MKCRLCGRPATIHTDVLARDPAKRSRLTYRSAPICLPCRDRLAIRPSLSVQRRM